MKKLLILSAVPLLLSQLTKAQTSQGNQTVGVNFSLYSYKQNEPVLSSGNTVNSNYSFTKWSTGPSYSYFIADKLDIGVQLAFDWQKATTVDASPSKSEQSMSDYGGNIFIRKYLMCNDKIGFRVGPYIGYSRGQQISNYITTSYSEYNKQNSNTYMGGVNAEIVYYPSKHIGISALLGNVNYQHTAVSVVNPNLGKGSANELSTSLFNDYYSFTVFYVFGSKG